MVAPSGTLVEGVMTASDMPDDAHKSGMTPSAAGEEAAQSQILPAAASDVEAHSTEKTTASDGDVEQQLISEVAKAKKPFAFFLALTCLLITTFLAALDSTCMAVSIAVSIIIIIIIWLPTLPYKLENSGWLTASVDTHPHQRPSPTS